MYQYVYNKYLSLNLKDDHGFSLDFERWRGVLIEIYKLPFGTHRCNTS